MKKIKRKLKFFLDTVVKSLTKFSYYKEIEKAKFSFSLKYLFFLFYILSLITSIVLAASLAVLVIPNAPKFISLVESKAISIYPDNLVVDIKNGQVASNQIEPYFITLPNSGDHFITIDTKADPRNYKNEKTAILITKDSVVVPDKNNTAYRVYPIDPSTNFTINKSSYEKVVSQIIPYLKYAEPALIVIALLLVFVWPVIAAAFSLIAQLVYLAIFSAIFFIITKLMKKDLKFKKIYQFTIHASTLPILLSFIVSAIGIHMPSLLGSAILFVFMTLVINER
jgi:hypothetical protein